MNVPGGWHRFYDEVADFTEAIFGVQRNSGFNAVLYFNEMVMPDDALSYPLHLRLEHNVSSYFKEHNSNSSLFDKFQYTIGDHYMSYSEIRQQLKVDNYDIFDTHQDWITHLEKFYISESLIRHLYKVNKSENAIKLAVNFSSKQEFLSTILQNIIHEPQHGEDVVKELSNHFEDLRDYPSTLEEIEYLEQLKNQLHPFSNLESEKKVLESSISISYL